MELNVYIDDSDIAPGHYLAGTLTLHLTAHYPQPTPPSPTHPTPYDNDPAQLYQHQLTQHCNRLLHASHATPPQLQVTELLDTLQLQVVGKVLPDATKVPKDVLKALTLDNPSLSVLSTAAVTLDRFDQPLPYDLLHQPYTYRWSVLLPAALPPSYRGHSHRIVYYVYAAAFRGKQLLLDTKLPFRVLVSPPYYSEYSDESGTGKLHLALAITATLEHKRVHPLLHEVTQACDNAHDTAADVSTTDKTSHFVMPAAESEREGSIETRARGHSFTSDDNGSLLTPPARQVFPTATLQRSYSASKHTPQLAIRTSAISTQQHASASSLLTHHSEPATPTTPPTPDYRSIRDRITNLRLAQLSNEPLTFPSIVPSRPLIAQFLSAIRTPLSFNITEQSHSQQAATGTATSLVSHTPLHVTHIRLERSAYRPGDTVRVTFDFSAAVLPTYRAWLTLDWVEETAGGVRHTQTAASTHVYCLSAVEVPVGLQVPRDATCNWASALMRGGWKLSFHFVIGRPRATKRTRAGSGWWWAGTADVEEERVERERQEREERRRVETMLARVEGKDSAVSSVSMAMMCAGDPNLQVSCLQWDLPLNVMPFYDDSEPTPASKGVVLEVKFT